MRLLWADRAEYLTLFAVDTHRIQPSQHPLQRKVPITVENKFLDFLLVRFLVDVQIQPAPMTNVLGYPVSRIRSAQGLFFASGPNAQFQLVLVKVQRAKGLLACAETGRAKLLILACFG